MSNNKITIGLGTDPESFLFDTRKNKIVNAVDIIPFDKEKPHDLGDGFTFFRDCCSVEGNIPPAYSKEEFVHNIHSLWDRVKKTIGGGIDISHKAAHIFTEEELKSEGSNELGCSPFFLSRTLEMAEAPRFKDGVRASGFHIAIGRADYKKCKSSEFMIEPMSKIDIINNMDLFVGVPSLVFDNDKDAKFRRSLYKNPAGSHRPQPWGCEYRPLSASCMRSPSLIGLIYDLTIMAVEATKEQKDFKITDDEVFSAMNHGNIDMANKIMERVLPKDKLKEVYGFANSET